MDVTSEQPRPSGWRRVRSVARTILVWLGAVAYPPALMVTVDGDNPPTGLALLPPLVLSVLPVGLLRRRPLPALGLMLAGALGALLLQDEPREAFPRLGVPPSVYVLGTEVGQAWQLGYLLALVNIIAVGYIAATRRMWVSVVAAVATFIVHGVAATHYAKDGELFNRTLVYLIVATAVAWLIGRSLRQRREHAAALREQATMQAVTSERLRIARELHDMIAHSIGVIAIQAGVGRRVIDTQPDEARNALSNIEDTSRETLAGLRRTLIALRRDEPVAGPHAASREPTPGLDDLDRLIATTADAGVRVAVRRVGEPHPLPADIELAAYRIVQEALANVVRHSGAGDCRVTIDYRETELRVQVDDDGHGGAGTGDGAGFGIVGMRERVELLRGRFTAGPRADGGFRVTALLPTPVVAQ